VKIDGVRKKAGMLNSGQINNFQTTKIIEQMKKNHHPTPKEEFSPSL
jgi:hypothetical protein